MPVHQLAIDLRGADPAAAEAACLTLGAISVALFDAGHDPVYEPSPGETPLWREIELRALFRENADPRLAAATLTAVLGLADEAIRIETLADRAWEREWLAHFRPMRFGRRLWVCPGGRRPDDDNAVVLELDPGLAFGTGTHPTTAACLEWLDARRPRGLSILDWGCGSGILALAALRLGAARAAAFDIDPQALVATRDNAARNGLGGRLQVAADAARITGEFDVVLANLLAGPLIALAPELARRCRPGGEVLLAGLLDAQAAEVADAYRPWFDVGIAARREGWTTLAGNRRAE